MTKLTPPPDPSQEKKLSFLAFDRKDYSRKYYEQKRRETLHKERLRLDATAGGPPQVAANSQQMTVMSM